jgi:Leucine-rich repeat (LRR) protein
VEDMSKLNSNEIKEKLEELKKLEIKNNPVADVPKEQIEKALKFLEEYSEEL